MSALRRHLPLAGLLFFAWILRAATGLAVQHHLDHTLHRQFLIPGDADGYWELGRHIARGEEYAAHEPKRRVMRMPGFPLALAICFRAAGEAMTPMRLWLATIGTAACWAVYLLGSKLVDRRVGLIACALAAVSPMAIGFSALVLSDTLFAFAITLSLVAGAHAVHAASAKKVFLHAALTGAAIAAACYVRPSWLLAAPVFALFWIAVGPRRKQALAGAAATCAATLLLLLPWGLRNERVAGHFVLTTLWAGPSLYDGLSPEATGASDMRFFDRDNLLAKMSEYEMDAHYRRAAKEWAIAHPRRTAELAAIKLWRYFKPWPSADQFVGLRPAIAIAAFYLPLLGLAALGAWRHRRDAWLLFLAAGPLLYFAAIHMAFVSSLRYRLPAEYALCVLAACGVLSIRDRWRRNRKTPPDLH